MESSPYLDPRFIVALVALAFTGFVALVGLIVWLVRLESKAGNAAERVDDAEGAYEKLKTAFYAHNGDETKHHNAEAFKEFREGLNNRFSTIDHVLLEINRKLDSLTRSKT